MGGIDTRRPRLVPYDALGEAMKTAVGSDYPEDQYGAYRRRYTALMTQVATAMSKAKRLGGRK